MYLQKVGRSLCQALQEAIIKGQFPRQGGENRGQPLSQNLSIRLSQDATKPPSAT